MSHTCRIARTFLVVLAFYSTVAWAASFPVAVVKTGTGTGVVKSSPAGIDCGANCTASVVGGTTTTVIPTPDASSVFDGWSTGPCVGLGACSFSVTAATTLTASFSKAVYTLTFTGTGNYFGRVHISPLNVDVMGGGCGLNQDGGIEECNFFEKRPINAGTKVVLDASDPTPNSYAMFGGWSGSGCSGTGACTFVMDGDKEVSASWDNARVRVSVMKDGDGDGRIESDFENIFCGDVCSATFLNGSAVSLGALAFDGSTFVGWDNPNTPCPGYGQCYVRLDGHIPKPVTAHFQARLSGLELHKSGTGDGSITSQPAGASCTEGNHVSCTSSWKFGTHVTLTATPARGSTFVAWDDPSCTGATCTLVMNTSRIITAAFISVGGGVGGCSVADPGRGARGAQTRSPIILLLVGVAIALAVRRRRAGFISLICLFGPLALMACGPPAAGTDGGSILLPKIVGPDENTPIVVHPGDPVTITVSLKNADGTLSTNYIWGWSPLQLFDGEGFTSTIMNPEPSPRTGTESIVVSWQQVGEYRVPGVVVAVGHSEISRSYGSPRIIVWGGPSAETVAVTNAMPMLVGEKRTAMVSALATVFPKGLAGGRTQSQATIAYSTRDANLATVDAHGVVTAVAVGSTTLDVQQGMDMAGRVSIPVTVTLGALGPPSPGVTPITGGPQLVPDIRTNVGIAAPADMHLSIDSRGYPIGLIEYTVQSLKTDLGTPRFGSVLASWSGSGFSLERINDGWFSMDDPRMVLDERDRIYVVGTGHISLDANLVIAERGAADGPAGWTYRSPDFRIPEQVAAGQHLDHAFTPTPRYAIAPRVGGGAWIASSAVFGRLDPALVPGVKNCLDVVYLTEVSDTKVTTQIVRRADFDWTATDGNCLLVNDSSALPFAITPPAPGEDAPQVVVMAGVPTNDHDATTRGVPTRWHKKSGVWSSESVSLIGDSVYTVPGSASGQPPLLMGHKASLSTTNFADHLGVTPQIVGNNASAVLTHYGFQTRDFAYAGAAYIGPVARLRFDRNDLTMDDGAFVFQSPQDPSAMNYITWSGDDLTGVGGVASDGKRLFFTSSLFYDMLKGTQLASLLTRALPGPVAKTTDAESDGTLVVESTFTPSFTQRPLILPDGTRYLLSDDMYLVNHQTAKCVQTPGVLLKSAGPGMPLTQVSARDASSLFHGINSPLWAVAGHLYGYSHVISPFKDVKLARSADGGVTWTAIASVPTTNEPYHQMVTASGEAWMVVPDFQGPDRVDAHLYHSTSVESGYAFQQSFGLTAQLAKKGWVIRATNQLAVVDAPDGVYELAVLSDAPTRTSFALFVRHIVAGLVDYETIAQSPVLGDHMLRLGAALVAGDGALVIQTEIYNKQDVAILHLDPKNGTSTSTVIPVPYDLALAAGLSSPSLTRLADARLVLAYATLVDNHKLGAVYRVSTDSGLTFSAPHALRPGGGWGQIVPGIAAEPSGGFLALVGDNEALGATVAGSLVTNSYNCGMYASYPPVRFTMQRVAAP